MKRLINIGLVLTSLIGYLEWGKDNHSFLFQAEYEIIQKAFTHSESLLHPFIIIPFLGQLLLLITVFQKEPSRKLALAGMICLSLILVFMFVIGIMAKNYKVFLSTLPFIVTAIIFLRYNYRNNRGVKATIK